MKKLAIGCGIALLVTGIVAAGLAYYVYRQFSSTMAQFAELSQVPELERGVRNQGSFVPPDSEELTDAQIEKLVQVQAEVRRRIGERMTEFEAKYKTLADKKDASFTDAPALLKAYADLAATWMDAKRAQIEALNTAGLSLDEYRWIREQSYRALGMPYMDFDMGKFVEQARSGQTTDGPGELRGSTEPAGPKVNQQRVARVKKQLEENIALASFGL